MQMALEGSSSTVEIITEVSSRTSCSIAEEPNCAANSEVITLVEWIYACSFVHAHSYTYIYIHMMSTYTCTCVIYHVYTWFRCWANKADDGLARHEHASSSSPQGDHVSESSSTAACCSRQPTCCSEGPNFDSAQISRRLHELRPCCKHIYVYIYMYIYIYTCEAHVCVLPCFGLCAIKLRRGYQQQRQENPKVATWLGFLKEAWHSLDFRVSIKHKYTIKHSLEWLLVISSVICMHNEHSFDELCYVSFVDRISLFCVIPYTTWLQLYTIIITVTIYWLLLLVRCCYQ